MSGCNERKGKERADRVPSRSDRIAQNHRPSSSQAASMRPLLLLLPLLLAALSAVLAQPLPPSPAFTLSGRYFATEQGLQFDFSAVTITVEVRCARAA